MSTRANIVINYKNEKWSQYYHHFDGYPEVVGRMLCATKILTWLRTSFKDDAARHYELYKKVLKEVDNGFEFELETKAEPYTEYIDNPKWCDTLHHDIEYLYTVDIQGESKDVSIKIKYLPILYVSYKENPNAFNPDKNDSRDLINLCLDEGTELNLELKETKSN